MYYPKGSTNSIIQALPGWSIAHYDEGTEGVFLQPVIAWFLVSRVAEYSERLAGETTFEKLVSVEVYPITSDGVEEDFSGLRLPDGTFDMPNVRAGMTEADYLEELKGKRLNASRSG
jgi:hypothetical protein